MLGMELVGTVIVIALVVWLVRRVWILRFNALPDDFQAPISSWPLVFGVLIGLPGARSNLLMSLSVGINSSASAFRRINGGLYKRVFNYSVENFVGNRCVSGDISRD